MSKITIITVTYNIANIVEETILSVLNSAYHSYLEYIIIDGGSSDGTIDIIKKYNEKINYWISEPDKGIYDAMNKAVEKSTGEWILFINGGDRLVSIPMQDLEVAKNQNYVALCGCIITNHEEVIKPSYSKMIKLSNTLPHQALFYYKQKMHSSFDISYRVFADYHYNLIMYSKKQKVMLSSEIVSFHSLDGISNNANSLNEFYSVISANCGLIFRILSFLKFKIEGMAKRLKIASFAKQKNK